MNRKYHRSNIFPANSWALVPTNEGYRRAEISLGIINLNVSTLYLSFVNSPPIGSVIAMHCGTYIKTLFARIIGLYSGLIQYKTDSITFSVLSLTMTLNLHVMPLHWSASDQGRSSSPSHHTEGVYLAIINTEDNRQRQHRCYYYLSIPTNTTYSMTVRIPKSTIHFY